MKPVNITDNYIHTLGLKAGKPDLALLQLLTQRHVAVFPFSSVGPLLGDDLPLDPVSLHDRIVVKQRGGYCFEQNGLMFKILEDLGFKVRLYLARVIYNQNIHPPLTHRITMVEIEHTPYIADVGFGPLGPYLPVSMSGETSRENLRTFRIVEPEPGIFHMQTRKDGKAYSLYKFELNNYGQADCEIGHFYSHKHPAASFVNNLVVSTITAGEVRSIRNRELTRLTHRGEQVQAIESTVDLQKTLNTLFNINVSSDEAGVLFEKSASGQ